MKEFDVVLAEEGKESDVVPAEDKKGYIIVRAKDGKEYSIIRSEDEKGYIVVPAVDGKEYDVVSAKDKRQSDAVNAMVWLESSKFLFGSCWLRCPWILERKRPRHWNWHVRSHLRGRMAIPRCLGGAAAGGVIVWRGIDGRIVVGANIRF